MTRGLRAGFWVLCLTMLVAPAQAAGKTVALVPAHVASGAAENGTIVADALRARLGREGF